MPSKPTGRPVGRPKGSVSARRAKAYEVMAQLERELGRKIVNPLEGLLRTASDPKTAEAVKIQCWVECLPYLYPKLQASSTQVSGSMEVEGPSVEINIGALIKGDENVRNAATTLAMAMCEADVAALDAGRGPQPKLLEAEFTD